MDPKAMCPFRTLPVGAESDQTGPGQGGPPRSVQAWDSAPPHIKAVMSGRLHDSGNATPRGPGQIPRGRRAGRLVNPKGSSNPCQPGLARRKLAR